MNKIFAFINLDWNTQKLYMKQMLILIVVGLVISISSKNTLSLQMLIGLGALIFVSYPFAIGDKTKLDIFYCTLPINRKIVVKARYLGASAILIIASLLGIGASSAINPIIKAKSSLDMQLIVLAILIIYLSLMFSVQTPLYFKFGYEKSKLITYFPIVVFALLSGAISMLGSQTLKTLIHIFNEIYEKPVLALGGTLVLASIFILISYRISLNIYEKKEF